MLSHEMAGDLQSHRREYEAAVARLMEENTQLKAELTHRRTQLHSAFGSQSLIVLSYEAEARRPVHAASLQTSLVCPVATTRSHLTGSTSPPVYRRGCDSGRP